MNHRKLETITGVKFGRKVRFSQLKPFSRLQSYLLQQKSHEEGYEEAKIPIKAL